MDSKNSFRLMYYLTAAQLYDEGKNIFDCFLAILGSVLLNEFQHKKSIGFVALKAKLNEDLMVDIPSATLDYLLIKLNNQNIITYGAKKRITRRESNATVEYEETISQNEERIRSFFCAFRQYLAGRNIDIDIDTLRNQCCNWIYAHTLNLVQLVDQGVYNKNSSDREEYEIEYEVELIEYLIEKEKQKDEEYEVFFLLYNGALQTSLLNFTPNKIEDICKGFSSANVILDSNFILRILGLQSKFESKVAAETLSCLKREGTNFYVLETTINEIVTSIKNFLEESEPYSQQLSSFFKSLRFRMNGLWEAYRSGVQRSYFLKLKNKDNLRNELQSLIDAHFIAEYDEEEIKKETIDDLIDYKGVYGYTDNQAKHDLALIFYCRKMRKPNATSISDANWWVLTNDIKLSRWNNLRSTDVQECLTEIQFNNLLWIQREKTDFSGLHSIMAYLANNDTLTIEDIHTIARRLNVHLNDDDSELDSMAIIFENTLITKKDIDLFEDEDKFEELTRRITKKKEDDAKNQEQSEKEMNRIRDELNNAREKNILLEERVNELQDSLEIDVKRNKIREIEQQIDVLNKKIEFYEHTNGLESKHKKKVEFGITFVFCIILYFIGRLLLCSILSYSIEFSLLPAKIDFAWIATVIQFIFFLLSSIMFIFTGKYIDKIRLFSYVRFVILRLIVIIYLVRKREFLVYISELLQPNFENNLETLRQERDKLLNQLKEYDEVLPIKGQ